MEIIQNLGNGMRTSECLETIEQILSNLKKYPNAYNHGMSEEMWMQECQREDAI